MKRLWKRNAMRKILIEKKFSVVPRQPYHKSVLYAMRPLRRTRRSLFFDCWKLLKNYFRAACGDFCIIKVKRRKIRENCEVKNKKLRNFRKIKKNFVANAKEKKVKFIKNLFVWEKLIKKLFVVKISKKGSKITSNSKK